jgi:hypothetical protein
MTRQPYWGPGGGLWHTYPHMSRNARRRQYRHQLRSAADPGHDPGCLCACCCIYCEYEGPMRALHGLTEDGERTWRYANGKKSYGPAPLPFKHRRTHW